LEEFQKAVERAHKSARERTQRDREALIQAERQVQSASGAISTSRQRVGTERGVEVAAADLRQTLLYVQAVVRLRGSLPTSAEEATVLSSQLSAMRGRLADARVRIQTLRAEVAQEADDLDKALEVAEARRVELETSLRARRSDQAKLAAALDDARRNSEALGQLAAAALPLLSSVCPVCLQAIDAADVEAELRRRADDSRDLLALGDQVTEVETDLRRQEEQFAEAEREWQVLHSRRQRRDEVAMLTKQAEEEVAALGLGTPIEISLSTAQLDAQELSWLEEMLSLVHRSVRDLESAFAASDIRVGLTAQEAGLAAAKDQETIHRDALQRSSEAEQRVDALLRATKEARVDVVGNRFARLRPLLNDFFARLDAHRAFTELDLEPQLYGRPGTSVMAVTRDPTRELAANPALVFSSAQANVAALCYFLALAWGAIVKPCRSSCSTILCSPWTT
jgi:DNA repair exonuclease SbcCD ATPase subunit